MTSGSGLCQQSSPHSISQNASQHLPISPPVQVDPAILNELSEVKEVNKRLEENIQRLLEEFQEFKVSYQTKVWTFLFKLYAISQLQIVRSGLCLVTYLNHCSWWTKSCPHIMMTPRPLKTISKCVWTLLQYWLRYSILKIMNMECWNI